MTYTVILQNRSYDLPVKTIAVTEKLDNAASVDSQPLPLKEKFRIVLSCVVDILGKDNAAEALGSTNLDEVDLTEVTLAFRKIVDAYNKPLQEYSDDKNRSGLEGLPIEQLKEVADAVRAIDGLQVAQGGKK